MDDLERDLTTLLRERADATEVPHLPLESVIARGEVDASRSRRRNGLIAVVAVAAVVAAIAIPVGVQSLRSSSPSPAAPATTLPSPSYGVVEFIRSVSKPSAIAFGADGEIATLWSQCGPGSGGQPCKVAWMMQSGVADTADAGDALKNAKTYVGWAPSDARLAPSGKSFVVTSYASDQGFVIEPDGSTTDLTLTKATALRASDLQGASVVEHSNGVRLVHDEDATWTPMSNGDTFPLVAGTAVGDTFWGELFDNPTSYPPGFHPHDIVRWMQDGTWHSHYLPGGSDEPAVIASNRRQVAVAYDDDGSLGFTVSNDGGATWQDVPLSSLPFTDVSAMSATQTGTLFVNTTSGELYRSTDDAWTTFERVSGVGTAFIVPSVEVDDVIVQMLADGFPDRLAVVLGSGDVTPYGPPLASLVPSLPPSPSPGASPTSLDDLPRGALPKVPYIRDGLVVMNGIPTKAPAHFSILSAGGVVIVGSDWSRPSAKFWVYRGFGWVRAPWLGDSPPVLDPDGRYAGVLSYPDASTTRITEVDPQTGHEYGHLDLDIPRGIGGGGGQVQLEGIDTYGNVYYFDYDPDSLMRWAPHKVPTKLGSLRNYVSVSPLGVVMKHDHEPGVLYRVRADTGAEKLPATASADGVWSSGGHRMLVGSTVVDVETGAEYPMALPPQMTVTPLGFEDDDTVELLVHNSGAVYPDEHPASILRCFVASQTCERAEDLSDLKQTQFPESF